MITVELCLTEPQLFFPSVCVLSSHLKHLSLPPLLQSSLHSQTFSKQLLKHKFFGCIIKSSSLTFPCSKFSQFNSPVLHNLSQSPPFKISSLSLLLFCYSCHSFLLIYFSHRTKQPPGLFPLLFVSGQPLCFR